MHSGRDFAATFEALTGHRPFPWQEALYERFVEDRPDNIPASCNLPTGLGKTAVIAIWLVALSKHPQKMPRRLVYVVNRRTVVDQTTREMEKLQQRLKCPDEFGEHAEALKVVRSKLSAVWGSSADVPLAISTLRGQFADNREWSADPSRPAVICGTVDMIGSRLLFSGYGVGFKAKPLHAGFLGQDALLVHDEAHLEPAFQTLIKKIEEEQNRERGFSGPLSWPNLRVMELTATTRGETNRAENFEKQKDEKPFGLTEEEKAPPEKISDPQGDEPPIHRVWRRLWAKKGIKFHAAKRNDVAKVIGEMARNRKKSEKAILVFVRRVGDALKVQKILTNNNKKEGVPADQVQVLTGTLRGLERDRMVTEDPVFARFLPEPKVPPRHGTVYLVCTSAGEVGVDISADHMICDLTTLDGMMQRLGRVNRRGDGAAEIDIVYESEPDPKKKDDPFEKARWKTKEILGRLAYCDWVDGERREASPLELGRLKLTNEERKVTFAPPPTILPATDILFDAWSMTSIRSRMPGRPEVEPYLHGVSEYEEPETYVAWREEVGAITSDMFEEYPPQDLLDIYPLWPHELLRDRSKRVFEELKSLAEHSGERPVWLVDGYGVVDATHTLDSLTARDESPVKGKTVLLPHDIGGLSAHGMLDGNSPVPENDTADPQRNKNDVADVLLDKNDNPVRLRANEKSAAANGMRLILTIKWPEVEDIETDEERRKWFWFEKPIASENSRNSLKPVLHDVHTRDVEVGVNAILDSLSIEPWIANALRLAAKWHDLGKCRERWQGGIGRPEHLKHLLFAKSGRKWIARREGTYRHEFGSLLDVSQLDEFTKLDERTKDLVLHLIAVHHGMGRPHFEESQTIDPEHPGASSRAVSIEVTRRFARLQRAFGHWGLAYVESILRAADWQASAQPSECFEEASP